MKRSPLTDLFGAAAQEKPLHMPFVVDIRTGQKISLPGGNLEAGGDWYDEENHKGHIKCPDEHCTARAHYQPEIEFKKGKPSKTREHFKTSPGQFHDSDCSIGKASKPATEKEMRGYVIYLNTNNLHGVIHPGARDKAMKHPYKRGKHAGAIKASAQMMHGLEPYSAKSARDIIDFMRTKAPEHIANSVVVWNGFQVPWRFFALYYNKSDNSREQNYRFRSFVKAMLSEGQQYMPVFMEVIPRKKYTAQDFSEKGWVLSRTVQIEDANGHKDIIVPRIFINTVHPHVLNAFDKGERHAVLAVAQVKKGTDGDILLDVSIQDPRQLEKVSFVEIKHENLLNQQRRTQAAIAPEVRPAP